MNFTILELELENWDHRTGGEEVASSPVRGGTIFPNYGHCSQTMAAFTGLLYARLQCLQLRMIMVNDSSNVHFQTSKTM